MSMRSGGDLIYLLRSCYCLLPTPFYWVSFPSYLYEFFPSSSTSMCFEIDILWNCKNSIHFYLTFWLFCAPQFSGFLPMVKHCKSLVACYIYVHVSLNLTIMIKFWHVGPCYVLIYIRLMLQGFCKLHLNCQWNIGNPYRNVWPESEGTYWF